MADSRLTMIFMKGLNALKSPSGILSVIIILEFIAAIAFMIRYPSNIGEIITLLFAAILTTATVSYAILTGQLISETEKTREVLTDPKMLVEVQPRFMRPPDPKREEEFLLELSRNPHVSLKHPRIEFDLIFRNIGSGPAYDITPKIINGKDIKVENPNESSIISENPINLKYLKKRINALTEGLSGLMRDIDYIAPNDKRSFFFGSVTIVPDYLYLAKYLTDHAVTIEIKYYKHPKEMRKDSEKPFTNTYPIDFSYLVELIPSIVRAGAQQ